MRQVVGWKEEENVMKTINQEKVEKEEQEGLETQKGGGGGEGDRDRERRGGKGGGECNEDN